MTRKRKKNKRLRILFRDGDVYITGRGLDIEIRSKLWFVKFNPIFNLRGFRKLNQKVIYINGKKFGHCYTRYACPTLPEYLDKRGGFGAFIGNFSRCVLGVGCRDNASEHMVINMQGHEFIVMTRRSENNSLVCDAYFSKSGRQLATFAFDEEFKMLLPYISKPSWLESVLIMAGYVACNEIYSTVIKSLNREIDVMC